MQRESLKYYTRRYKRAGWEGKKGQGRGARKNVTASVECQREEKAPPAMAPRASSPAMAAGVPRPALEASPESLPITSLQGAHPPLPGVTITARDAPSGRGR